MRNGLATAMIVFLAGCAGHHRTPAAAPASLAVSPVVGDGACVASKAQAFVGRQATVDSAEAARNAAGARAVRTIAPGMMVTMDYRADRLNLTTDTQGRVASVRCG